MPVKKGRDLLGVCLAVGILIRIAAIIVFRDYHTPLTAEYGVVAENLVAGKGFVGGGWLGPEGPTALNVPVYSLFLASFLYLHVPLPYLWIEMFQALLSASLILLIPEILRLLTGGRKGYLISACLTAVYPPFIYFPKQISPAIFATFFTALSLWCCLDLFEQPRVSRAVVAGFFWGIAVQVEPIALAIVPTMLGVRWLFSNRGRSVPANLGQSVLIAALVGMGMLAPWTIRNQRVFGHFIPLKTSFGLNFWMGNNPAATGHQYTEDGKPIVSTIDPQTLSVLASMDEASRYQYLQREGMDWIRSHPDRFAELTLKRVYYFWVMSPTFLVTTENIQEPLLLYYLRMWLQIPVLLLAAVGGVLAYRNRERRLLVAALSWMVVFTAPYAISVAGNTRFRLPAEPALLLLGGYGIAVVLTGPARNVFLEKRWRGWRVP
jgi:hypothetical protein